MADRLHQGDGGGAAAAAPSPTEGERWRQFRPSWSSRALIVLLLVVIAVNETQRTMAQAAAHRERQDLMVEMKEMRLEMGWLLYQAQPAVGRPLPPLLTSMANAPHSLTRPGGSQGSSAR